MYLTLEKIKSLDACEAGVKWFERHFPQGAELTEVIKHPNLPSEFLHWGYQYLQPNEKEKNDYWKKAKIECDNPRTISNSLEVTNSDNVLYSRHVDNSHYVCASKKVSDSEVVQSGREVKNSQWVFDGKYIEDSKKIFCSSAVVNSSNISKSEQVSDSTNILESKRIKYSGYIVDSADIEKSYFLNNCQNIINSLFCDGLNEQKDCLFNIVVTPEIIAKTKDELLVLLSNWNMNLVPNWGEKKIPLDFPLAAEAEMYYKELPSEFFDWVQTLPGYDEDILFNILKMNK